MVTGDGYGESGEVFVFLSFFKFLLLVDGYGRWLREMVMESLCFAFSRFFSLWAMVTGCLCFPLREAAPGKKSAVGSKQVFLQCLSLKTAYRQEWEMVTGDRYGKSWEGFVFLSFFKFFLLVDGYEKWLREMVMESLCFAFFSIFSLWAMVTGCLCFPLREAAPGKKSAVGSKQVFLQCLSLKTAYRQEWEMVTGDRYGKSWEGFVFLSFFKFFLLVDGYEKWLREMVMESLCFAFFSIFSLWAMVTGCLCFPLREAAPGKNLP